MLILNHKMIFDVIIYFCIILTTLSIIGVDNEFYKFKKMVLAKKKIIPSSFYEIEAMKSFFSFRFFSLLGAICIFYVFENNIKTEISLFLYYYIRYALFPAYLFAEMFLTAPGTLYNIFLEKEKFNQKGNS